MGGALGTRSSPLGPNLLNFMQLLGKMENNRLVLLSGVGTTPSPSGKFWIRHCKFLQTEITLTHIHLRNAAQLVVLHSDPKSSFMMYLSPSVVSVSKCREGLGLVYKYRQRHRLDRFDGHFKGQGRCATHFAHRSVHHH